MAKKDLTSVTTLLLHDTGPNFSNQEFVRGDWGQVDSYAELKPDRYLFFEVETGQKHPALTC